MERSTSESASGAGRQRARRKLALVLATRFRDPALAQAGFLSAWNSDSVQVALSGQLTAGVAEILRGRERLIALDPRDPKVTHQLAAQVLPSLPDGRAGILLVMDQLLALDPAGAFTTWSRRFHLMAQPLGKGIRAAMRRRAHPDLDRLNWTAFLERVAAPTALFFSLWSERDALEDAVLLLSDESRFDQLVRFALRAGAPRGDCEGWVRAVRHALRRERELEIRWEWRHLASMHRAVRQDGEGDDIGREHLHHCGFVTVICPDDRHCYAALGKLHHNMPYDVSLTSDLMGQGRRTGYQAIHTTVLHVTGGEHKRPRPISVRIIPRSADGRRFASSGHRVLATFPRSTGQALGLPDVEVFTPNGQLVRLPTGSTILNFAAEIHRDFVALARGARINRQPVGLLDPLSPGDVIWLDIGDTPRPLPRGWQERVPRATIRKIRYAFLRSYYSVLVREGRGWLRQQLVAQGLGELPDEEGLHRLVAKAESRLLAEGRISSAKRDPHYWVAQLGLWCAIERGEQLLKDPDVDKALRSQMLKAILREVENERILASLGIELTGSSTPEVRKCQLCGPSPDDRLVGESGDSTLTLHRAGAACAGEATAVRWERHYPKAQYVVLELSDRTGIAADVLTVFHGHEVGISDLAALRYHAGKGIMRVRLDPVGPGRLSAIIEQLGEIAGVVQVYAPADEAPEAELKFLSPRMHEPLPAQARPSPYNPGLVITREEEFYDREIERACLHEAYQRLSRQGRVGGEVLFVRGPKKIGKSSLVQAFFRDLDRREHPPLMVHRFATVGDSWSRFSADLVQALSHAARTHVGSRAAALPADLHERPLIDVLSTLQQHLGHPVVLAIDEAPVLLWESARAHEENQVLAFWRFVQHCSHILVLWIGPTAGVRLLPETMRQILAAAFPIDLHPFDEGSTRALLVAQKYGARYAISCPVNVARAVRRETGGNPYWIQALALRLFTPKRNALDGPIRYSRYVVHHAMQELAADASLFMDRYREDAWPRSRREQATGILDVLAGDHDVRECPALSAREIQAALGSRQPRTSVADILDLMEELEERGAVVPAAAGHAGEWRWCLAAPALAQHVRTLRTRSPRWKGL
ncbi:MAG: TGS domain-containing protein [Gemmatimonadetes bacterium]|nr:TGS domain-containing protein [Gemmatimonadota bacterium]